MLLSEFVMTDARVVSHTFRLPPPLSSSAAVSLLDESVDDESAPLHTTPFPSTPHPPSTDLCAAFDLALSVTPERTVPTRVPLQTPVPGVSEDDFEQNHRATKVHFDQTVSVHHLSPEYCSRNEPPDDYRLSELNIDVLSSMCNEINTSESDVEPLSVIASDLRRLSPNSLSLLSDLESSRGMLQYGSAGTSSSSASRRKKKPKSRNTLGVQMVTELGNTDEILTVIADDNGPAVQPECVLAKPEFNSTLKMSSEIAQLQEQQFDLVAVTKEKKISPKLKQQVFEKVLTVYYIITLTLYIILSTKYLRVCLFCLGHIFSETPHHTTAEFCMQTRDDHVQDMCWVLCL